MSPRVPLSILDLVPVSQGHSRHEAFEASAELAQAADNLGYLRYWVAEHHGSDTFMASATSLVLGFLAERTARIRLGSGGVMLPNHSPLMVAEYYGTLVTMHGPRFDLGLGRAPGTDPMTAAALQRHHGELDTFARDVDDLRRYLGDPGESRVRAVPGEGTHVPLWMLGSSLGGAQVAAALGLPYAFASHFAPDALDQALALYRQHFTPSPEQPEPHSMAGVTVLVAPSQDEAEFLFTTSQLMRVRIRTGQSAPLDPPVHDLGEVVHESARHLLGEASGPATMVGTPESVVAKLDAFIARTGVDELIVTTYTHDPDLRIRSFELLAAAWPLDEPHRAGTPIQVPIEAPTQV
ncbi:MAG: LLM class flavin-dependent oxidoreductase [Propionibacterium sp.]|nr:LLM class flavin-dependent oxidoreductase [Propionibacterium sp.]